MPSPRRRLGFALLGTHGLFAPIRGRRPGGQPLRPSDLWKLGHVLGRWRGAPRAWEPPGRETGSLEVAPDLGPPRDPRPRSWPQPQAEAVPQASDPNVNKYWGGGPPRALQPRGRAQSIGLFLYVSRRGRSQSFRPGRRPDLPWLCARSLRPVNVPVSISPSGRAPAAVPSGFPVRAAPPIASCGPRRHLS